MARLRLVGMVHLPALPGAPRFAGRLGAVVAAAPDPDDVARVRQAVPGLELLVGSGVDARNVHRFLALADGFIVGSSLKRRGRVEAPLDRRRVDRFVAAVGAGR